MKIAIIAEKPSVAREIAAIVGATSKQDGYIQGNNYIVTWAFGHLIQLAMPEEYGAIGFKKEHLPILPEKFILKPRQTKEKKEYKDDPGALKQLKVIQSVFKECDKIIVATDAGREGELIFRYIYNYLGCDKPFDRLWISSLTEKAIKEGLQNLKNGTDYDTLYHAAKARSEADWLVGINASQALSIAAGQGVFSLGRVQTPTLAMICSRYLENKHFIPAPFWQLQITSSKDGQTIVAISKERIEDGKIKAHAIYDNQQQFKEAKVERVEKKEVNQEPPLLYDLTTLQKEANSKHGFSADKTLSIAQKLYEDKLISYPRTGSRYISDDMFPEIGGLINQLKNYSCFTAYATKLSEVNLNTRSVDNKKITDHHALLITENRAEKLSSDEKKLYEMIAGRMLEAFSGKCVKDMTTLTLSIEGYLYETKGSVTKIAGWREVFNEQVEDAEDRTELPDLAEGETLPIEKLELLEKQTKPKSLHTEASLLGAMETAGKDLDNEEQRLALKSCGIGTPATRAAIIETLFSRDYMIREKKSLVPTEKGLAVYDAIKDKRIADVELTGMWEDAFAKIESGAQDADNFKKGIEVYTSQITEELLASKISLSDNNVCQCPKCKNANLRFYPMVIRCPDESCSFILFRKRNEKLLTDKQIISLLTIGKTEVIKGFKAKSGKTFDASLILDDELNINYKFPENKKKKK